VADRYGHGVGVSRQCDDEVRRPGFHRPARDDYRLHRHDRYRYGQLHRHRADSCRNARRTPERVAVRLGDSDFPASSGSGGQWGGNSSTAGVYAACVKLRETVAKRAGFKPESATFSDGNVSANGQSKSLAEVAGSEGITVEDYIEFGELTKKYAQATFGAHFAEVGVDSFTGEVRVRRMSGAFAAGRILNPKTARSQVIGAMTMGLGAALMEEAIVDVRHGYFVNHDLAEYQVPVHADVPVQDVFFMDEVDAKSSPMKAKGVGELGLCGSAAAIANAVYNACGVRIRDYPLTLDKIVGKIRV